jgi:flagellar hook-length control protein FliK
VVTATTFPFPATSRVGTPTRPPAPAASNRVDFGGAMDDALDTRAREASDKGPPVQARKGNTAKPASRPERSERPSDDAPVGRKADSSSTTAPVVADQPETPADAKTESGAIALAGEQTSENADPEAIADVPVVCDPASLVCEGAGARDADAIDGDDPLARGRRWAAPSGDATNTQERPTPNAVANGGKGIPGLGLKVGHAIRQAGADASAAPGEALAQIAKDVVAAAHADAGAAEGAGGQPVTEAIESAAAKTETAAASAESAVETVASALETVAAVDASADTNAGDAPPQDHAQAKPQASNTQANPNTAVAVGGVENGARFTVNSAAGNAAYTSAAPRAEETVLPQIVQSIRMQAVQGTTEARVQLKPEHLGNVNITLRVEHNQVTATIQADVAAVRQWIESHESSLRQSLSEQGLQLARLEVHPDGQQAARDEQNSDQSHRQQRRRSYREEATFEVLV